MNGFVIASVAYNDFIQARFKIIQIRGEAEDSHHLGRDCNVIAILSREAIAWAAESTVNAPQSSIIHIGDTFPHDASSINFKAVAPVDVIIY